MLFYFKPIRKQLPPDEMGYTKGEKKINLGKPKDLLRSNYFFIVGIELTYLTVSLWRVCFGTPVLL